MTRPIHVLHVDDDPGFARLTADALAAADDRLRITAVDRAEAALDRLDDVASPADCVVSDYDMPGRDGLALLEAVRAIDPDLPFVLFTGKGSEEVASEAISAGVTDYLRKGPEIERFTVLANRIVRAVEARRTARDLERRRRRDAAVTALGRAALEEADLESLCERAVDVVAEGLDVEYAKVLDLDAEADHLRLVAGRGWHEGLVGTATVGTDRDSQAGYTLSVAEPVVVPDLRTERRFHGPPLLTDHDVTSGISVVVGSLDAPWGVLGAHTTARRAFDDADADFLRRVANVLASAVDRRETDRRRRESEALFREIAELSPETVFRLDTTGEFVYVSPAVESLVGHAPSDLVGTAFGRYVVDADRETAADGYGRVLDGEVVRGLRMGLVAADGDVIEVAVSAAPVRHDDAVAFVQGFVHDVTDRIERERRLETLKAQYETVVAHVPDWAVFLFDEDLRYRLAGGAELSAAGFAPDDFEGVTPREVLPQDLADETVRYYRETLAGRACTYEQSFRGERYRVRTVPVRNDDGEVVSGMVVSQNVTEERRRRAELERHNRRLSEFASVVSHDLRNPLSIASGRLRMARTDPDGGHLDEARRAVDRCLDQIDHLLSIARCGETVDDPDPVPIADAVAAAWRNVPTADATLTVSVPSDATVSADRPRLERLFENLFGNAVEHGGPDVVVTVEAVDDEEGSGIAVVDTGPGIDPGARARAFEPGFSPGESGSGLGLYIVERIADAHDWTVAIVPTDEGTRVEVRGVETVDHGVARGAGVE